MVVDAHVHWGPSYVLGTNVTTKEILRQMELSGVERVVAFPFPSAAIRDPGINLELLREAEKAECFIPFYYVPDDLSPIPQGFFGGKWHWLRGVQDASSNYKVLEDSRLPDFLRDVEKRGLPLIVEEELRFTEILFSVAGSVKFIVPHMGMLGGDPMDFLEAFRDTENVHFDTSLASSNTIKRFIEAIGPERIIFGSDVPFGYMPREKEKLEHLDLPKEFMDLILHGNIERLLEGVWKK